MDHHDRAYRSAAELLELLGADKLDQAGWAHAALICLVIAYNIEQAREDQCPKTHANPSATPTR